VVGWWRIDKKRSARKRSALETAVSVDKIRRGWDAGIEKLSDLLERLIDARERRPPSQHFQRFKQWRGVLATADGYTNRLEHLSGFHWPTPRVRERELSAPWLRLPFEG
jgi:hypothetical protein